MKTVRIVCLGIALAAAAVLAQDRAPKLIVLLVVDQMRADYVDKFQHQWTGGLHRLVTAGAWFRQAEYPYFGTVTCAGHATISTGSYPSTHGMIQNRWWDRDRQAELACADDESASPVSYGKPAEGIGESARNLRTATLADELRAQLSPAARVVSFSFKARSAVTLGGQRPDVVAWFKDEGMWVSSTAFGKAPVTTLADFVTRHPVEADFGKTWDRTMSKSAYLYEGAPAPVRSEPGFTPAFPHALKGDAPMPTRRFYDQWQSSPYADEYLAMMALDVAERLRVGQGSSNLLAISFSALDRVGHVFGPNSHEVQDVLIRLDRTLAGVFDRLDGLVGAGRYTVALTADHGVAPLPERMIAEGVDAGRLTDAAITGAIDRSLQATLGVSGAVARFLNTQVYLKPGVFERMTMAPGAEDAVRAALRAVPGVLDVYTRDQVAANRFEGDAIGRRLALSYYPGRSGDLMVVPRPYWLFEASGASHGSPFEYDARVPLFLMGKGIVPGEYLTGASPADIAPTLAFLAGITLPRPQGRVLSEAMTSAGNLRH
jgi:predicted AlkP superfamily pyrophosphatase or phosphodiesterase